MRLIAIAVAIVAGTIAGLPVSAPAWAVSASHDYGNAPAAGARGGRDAEYNFSGKGFNFSISRPTNDDDSPRAQGSRPQQDQNDRSWFDRLRQTIEDLFRG
ncbi:hypothetical protein [Azospirillum sp. TSH100]|uniref:hypothetical protein n=1 Tax=Azospirillum sp. TSH100 TaxID=652764 RepID=UPI0010AAAA64|nr:hypothetical protein [Azospirillum sp. TSH100]QCG89091.1 hypothetical protein E6C72_14845 [Azospirillum sp. TSH100]